MKDKPSILVVDDDPNISRLEQLYLEKENFDVRVADRGDTALEETVREFGREGIHLEGAFKVGREGHDGGVGLSGFEEAGAEAAAGVFLSCVDVFFHIKSLLKGFHLTV